MIAAQAAGTTPVIQRGKQPRQILKPDTAEMAPVRKYEMQIRMPPTQPTSG